MLVPRVKYPRDKLLLFRPGLIAGKRRGKQREMKNAKMPDWKQRLSRYSIKQPISSLVAFCLCFCVLLSCLVPYEFVSLSRAHSLREVTFYGQSITVLHSNLQCYKSASRKLQRKMMMKETRNKSIEFNSSRYLRSIWNVSISLRRRSLVACAPDQTSDETFEARVLD